MFISSCQIAERSASPAKQEAAAKKIYVIGQRGAAGLASENTLSAFARACEIGVDAVEFDILLTADRKTVSNIQTAHQLGIRVFVWTPDSRSEMKRLIDMGVDGIITNRPDIPKAVLKPELIVNKVG